MLESDSVVSKLERENRTFQSRFVQILVAATGVASVMLGGVLAVIDRDPVGVASMTMVALVCGTGFVAARRGYVKTATYMFLIIIIVGICITVFSGVATDRVTLRTAPTVFVMVVALAGYLLGSRPCIAFTAIGATLLVVMTVYDFSFHGDMLPGTVTWLVLVVVLIALVAAAVVLFVNRSSHNLAVLHGRLNDIELVVTRSKRIAEGDLSGRVEGDSDVSDVMRAMLDGLRTLVGRMREMSSRLASATNEIAAMAREQEQGSVQQATAVQETRKTLEALVGASREIANSSQGVLQAAESNLNNNELIAEQTQQLTAHTHRISEILEIIKEIANKSELLALNASLEGAKAGEAGRGFSLVAAHMQRLSENVMSSLRDVRALTEDIRKATDATVTSTEHGTKLAADTTQAARQIGIVTQQQRTSTEQATQAMDDIAEVTSQVASGAAQTLSATQELAALSKKLDETVNQFRL